MASDRLSLRLPEPLRNGLEHRSKPPGEPNRISREAIEEYLLRHAKLPTCFDIAEQAGLLGCVESGTRDLSTNPRHLEGFGK